MGQETQLARWHSLGDNEWRTVGDNDWSTVADNRWRTVGDNAWHSIPRRMTIVDEYDSRTYFQRKYRGYRRENGAVIRNLCEREKVGKRSVYDCMKALREETCHALAERRSNPDTYVEFQTESDETLAVLREQDERAMQ